MKLANGVDLIDIERVQDAIERHGERFLQRVYTERELALCGEAVASLAVRHQSQGLPCRAPHLVRRLHHSGGPQTVASRWFALGD